MMIKNAEDKNEEQLNAIKNQGEKQLKTIRDKIPNKIGLTKDIIFENKLSLEGKRKLEETARQERKINHRNLVLLRPGRKESYNFSIYRRLQGIYFGKMSLENAYDKEAEFEKKWFE